VNRPHRKQALARRPGTSLVLASVLLFPACRLGTGASVEPVPIPAVNELERGTVLLASGAFGSAETVLRQIASSCESGADGRRAILLLAALRLDPRNPAAHPDSAAAYATSYLALSDHEPSERPLAESLYLMALDRGAVPGPRPAVPGGVATRFSDCDAPEPPVLAPLALPTLGREPMVTIEARLRAQRDTLATRAAQLGDRNEALEQRVRELEAELQRIRRLLGGPPGPPTSPERGPG
jgi:hypothetical protein